MKEQENSATPPTYDEIILCLKLMMCSIEGVCSGIKADPDYLTGYRYCQELLQQEVKSRK